MSVAPCSWNSFYGYTTCDPFSYLSCPPYGFGLPWFGASSPAPPPYASMCPPQPAPAAHPNCCPPQFAPAAAPQDPTKPSTKKPSTFPGTELLYSRDAVTIRVVKDGKKPWKMAAGAGIPYVTYKIGSDLSLGQLCARLGHDVAKTTVIEALEIGNGRWAPGKSTKVADNKAKTLAEMGWEGKRDAVGGLGPVWMVIKVA